MQKTENFFPESLWNFVRRAAFVPESRTGPSANRRSASPFTKQNSQGFLKTFYETRVFSQCQ
ncbi:hypothetical protein HMPREF7215_1175 [Pyramidobacter piscolens W5455]|uniref:Uncharacterized protein n=1 Tax=Pyramidobacter piscolens W5455 TaxID=352165 RepID=A0ABP2HSE2_9BACT|nr:hypothetical protein HMPREF7215_1175 [Pyramidobacter piscolens W5455]